MSDLHGPTRGGRRQAAEEQQQQQQRRHVSDTQQQFRKAGIMFDLVTGLLRIMEFIAVHMPEVRCAGQCRTVCSVHPALPRGVGGKACAFEGQGVVRTMWGTTHSP